MVALVTAMIAYPNPYTRMNTSELIYLLFSQCGVTNQARAQFHFSLEIIQTNDNCCFRLVSAITSTATSRT